jgi:hypothetical protein
MDFDLPALDDLLSSHQLTNHTYTDSADFFEFQQPSATPGGMVGSSLFGFSLDEPEPSHGQDALGLISPLMEAKSNKQEESVQDDLMAALTGVKSFILHVPVDVGNQLPASIYYDHSFIASGFATCNAEGIHWSGLLPHDGSCDDFRGSSSMTLYFPFTVIEQVKRKQIEGYILQLQLKDLQSVQLGFLDESALNEFEIRLVDARTGSLPNNSVSSNSSIAKAEAVISVLVKPDDMDEQATNSDRASMENNTADNTEVTSTESCKTTVVVLDIAQAELELKY